MDDKKLEDILGTLSNQTTPQVAPPTAPPMNPVPPPVSAPAPLPAVPPAAVAPTPIAPVPLPPAPAPQSISAPVVPPVASAPVMVTPQMPAAQAPVTTPPIGPQAVPTAPMSTLFPETIYTVTHNPKLLKEVYQVHDARGTLVAHTEVKLLSLKLEMDVFADEAKTRPLMRINSMNAIGTSHSFDVVDAASGQKIGSVKFKDAASFLNDHWEISNKDGGVVAKVDQQLVNALLGKSLPNITQTYVIAPTAGAAGSVLQKIVLKVLTLSLTIPAGVDHALAVATALLIAQRVKSTKAL